MIERGILCVVLTLTTACHDVRPQNWPPPPPPAPLVSRGPPPSPESVLEWVLYDPSFTRSDCDQAITALGRAAEWYTYNGQGEQFARLSLARDVKYNLAALALRCGRTEEARLQLAALLDKHPKHHHARVQLALLEVARDGDLDKAIAQMDRAIQDAEFRNVHALLSRAVLQLHRNNNIPSRHANNDQQRGHLDLLRATAVDDRVPEARALLIRQLSQSDPTVELAVELGKATLADFPRSAVVRHAVGLAYLKQGSLTAAASRFREAADLGLLQARMDLGSVLLMQGSYGLARAVFEAVLEHDANHYDVLLGLGYALRGQGGATRLDAANKHLERAVELAPSRSEAHYNLGVLWHERAKDDAVLHQAKHHLEAFIALPARDTTAEAERDARQRLADIAQQLGDP